MDRDIFDSIMRGAGQAANYMEGKRKGYRVTAVAAPDKKQIKATRQAMGMTQEEFAYSFSISVNTLRHWEAGRRTPEGPASVLFKVIQHNPEAVLEALGHYPG